jgi:ribonuclease BN (tRNA processing enzyme)
VADGQRTWRILLDLGSGALGALQRVVGPFDLDAVVISHLHPDHFMDLCGLYVARRYDPRLDGDVPPLPIYGPQHTARRILQAYGPDATDELPRIYAVREMADGAPFQVGPVTVTPRLVRHPVPAFGVRLDHGGASIAYSGDTDSCPALLDLARDADLLLCEASFQENRDDARGVHLTGRRAGEAAAEAGARRLVLTHLPPWTDPATVLAEAQEVYAGPAEVARPGLRIGLGSTSPVGA